MDIKNYFVCVDEVADWLKEKIRIRPRITIVLSGGLEAFLKGLSEVTSIPFGDIPHFPPVRVEGHSGRVVFGRYADVPVVVMAGRYHCYEGHSPQAIVFPHFVFAKLGSKMLITTNAVGGVKRQFKPGDIMLVKDHINMMGVNPLIGLAVQRKTNQFTSMTNAYDEKLRAAAIRAAKKIGVKLRKGVYLASMGPSYETKAEIRAFRRMGADAVGMSTVPEVIAANFLGMSVLSFSCIANAAADLHRGKMSHTEVLDAMANLAPRMVRLLKATIEEISA